MKVLSVRQPWAHAIIHLGKDVENRSWPTDYRGPLAIHAGKTPDRPAFREFQDLGRGDVEYGAIVGVVRLADVRQDMASLSPWASAGQWHWVLAQPQAIEPIPCLGQLKLWDVPELLRKRVERALTR